MQKTILIAFTLLALLPGSHDARVHASLQLEIDDLFNQSAGPEIGDPVFNYSLQTNSLTAGAHAVLTIAVKLPADRYTYSMLDENSKTQVRFEDIDGLEPTSGFIPDRKPEVKVDKILGWTTQKFYDEITWSRHYRITDPTDAKLGGTITGAFCSESSNGGGGSCLPFSDEFALNVAVTQDKLPASPAAVKTRPFAMEVTPTRKSRGQQKPDPLKLQIALTPEDAAAGDEVTLSIRMELKKGWHTFSLDQNPENAGLPTEIDVTPNGLVPVDDKFTPDREPHKTTVETFEIVEQLTFEDQVTWSRRFRVTEGVAAGGYGADGSIRYQVCKESCLPPKGVKFGLGAEGNGDKPPAAQPETGPPKSIQITVTDSAEHIAEMAALYNVDTAIKFDTLGGKVKATLMTAIFGAFVGGILLNLMPCVFPVLGLKVMGFVQLAGNDPKKIRMHGIAFTAGLVASMWCLAGIILTLRASTQVNWGQQMGNSYFVGGIIILLFVLGLNMAGVFEMGTSMTRVGGNLTQKKGYTQSFFSGILTTLIATPCSGPFLGAAMGFTLAQPAPTAMFLFTVFGLGIALPYLLLSFFPALINKLPRPGAWMETFKVTMAFALFATAAFFMKTYGSQTGVTGLSWMLMALVVIGLAGFFYGHYSLPHLKPGTRFWKGLILPLTVAGLGGWMAYDSAGYSGTQSVHSHGGLAWQNWQPGKVEFQTAKKNKIVWVDYTADW